MKTYVKSYDPLTDYDDVVSLKLKQKDLEEVEASSGVHYTEVLEYIAKADYVGEKFVLVHEGKIEAILGVSEVPDMPEVGIVYFLSTDKLQEFKFFLVKYTRATLKLFFEKYKVLTNYTTADYTESIQWLTGAGAVWDESEYILADPDVPFKQFYLYREVTNV